MRRIVIALLLTLGLSSSGGAFAQLNKAYFNYIARSFLIDSRYREAIETLNVLLRVDENAYEAYFLRGVAKYNLDDVLGAEMDFSMAIQKNPVYTMAYTNRAIMRAILGNYDDALKDFAEAIDLRPDLPGPYYSRGVTYLLSQQFENAIADFDQYIKLDNINVDAYLSRGTAYLYLSDTTKAYENYDQAIRTNRLYPQGYYRRGSLRMAQKDYQLALEDFNMSLDCDSTYVPSYFNRALAYSYMNRPVESIADFDRVIELDSTSSLTYFNRAIVRSEIGDYNRALEDYDQAALYSPNNVLLFYNRANLHTHLGNIEKAIEDYGTAIELYPDFANAYLNRSYLRYLLNDQRGSQADRRAAELKIAEYRSKLDDSTFSIYADTSRKFNELLAFDSKMTGAVMDRIANKEDNIKLLPMFRFSLVQPDTVRGIDTHRYYIEQLDLFSKGFSNPNLQLTTKTSDIPVDSLFAYDSELAERIALTPDWPDLFMRGITQSLVKQYTNSVASYTEAIDKNPANPFLYLNRSATQSEMIDFISSIDNSYQRLSIDSDPSSRLKTTSSRTYNYDEAIADLNKAAKLLPQFAHIYYNRANLHALSGRLPEAYDDYTKAIELYPNFAEAYFNRGLVQIYLKDTRKGCLDLSKAGELGIGDAYEILKRFSYEE